MTGWRDFTDLRIMLRAMAHVDRLNILHQLAGQGEVNVTDLVSALAISQPLVSWHLRILRHAGLVCTRRHGRTVFCSLDIGRFAACQRALDELVAPAASAGTEAGATGPLDAPHAWALPANPAQTAETSRVPRPSHPRHAGSSRARAGPTTT